VNQNLDDMKGGVVIIIYGRPPNSEFVADFEVQKSLKISQIQITPTKVMFYNPCNSSPQFLAHVR
jgi:hypothetical protein